MSCILHYAFQIPYLVRLRLIFFFNLGTFEDKVDKWIFDVGQFTDEHSEKKKTQLKCHPWIVTNCRIRCKVPILVLCFELHTYYSFKETLITVFFNKLWFSWLMNFDQWIISGWLIKILKYWKCKNIENVKSYIENHVNFSMGNIFI